jgi:hypothetical protein
MDIVLQDKQRQFCNSNVRFPGFVGCWGSGKTMCGIIRGLLLSETYPNNLGLIVRKRFTDLRDSTLKDFERYTGLNVKKDDKEVKLKNGSVIMFRHGEELSGLQNVNLGWYMMEQAEEFETAEQFDMLRGRLRRQEAGIRQGLVIANQAGHNWVWKRFKKAIDPDYSLTEADINDCRAYLPADTLRDWEKLKTENIRKYNRYVMNSWEDYDLEGAYYANLMSDALKSGRIQSVPYDVYAPVYTFWDLGYGDTTVIWFVQFIGKEIHLIDYYENNGEALSHYVNVVNKKEYRYGTHYAPHDVDSKQLQTGKSLKEIALMLGLRFYTIERHSIETRIEAVRSILSKCWFSNPACEAGIDAMNAYKKKKNETLSTDDRPVFSDTPLHDWASNGADAFGYMAYVYRFMMIGGEQLGSAIPRNVGYNNNDADIEYDLAGVGRYEK